MEFTLYIFGNANEDMNLDQQEIDLINDIAAGKTGATHLADANQDGKVDSADADQVKKIIDGTATEIWVQDAFEKPVKVKTPVNRLITLDRMNAKNGSELVTRS